ncbi:MAG TPA: ROK family protein [Thermotogota bacterium]|nr:ROK family protein [Thermotogota bacterium]HRW91949.1 ROK family protein [Thermotogota bacterium]
MCATKAKIAVDIGGTKILGALFDEEGTIVQRKKKATKAYKGEQGVFDQLCKVIDGLLEHEQNGERTEAVAIGAGCPGVIRDGFIHFTPNLPWSGFDLKAKLEEKYGLPTSVGNDANVSLLGEWKYGAAKGFTDVVGYFIGTGIGGGLICNGKLYTGSIGAAGEIGHMILLPDGPFCGCGARGCLESVASKTGILKEIRSQVERGRETLFAQWVKEEDYILKSSHFKEAVEAGDGLAREILDDTGRFIGVSCASMINLLNPELVVLGGGVMQSLGDLLLPSIVEHARQYAILQNFQAARFTLASLGDDACLFGALSMVQEKESNREA